MENLCYQFSRDAANLRQKAFETQSCPANPYTPIYQDMQQPLYPGLIVQLYIQFSFFLCQITCLKQVISVTSYICI
jgi:hypothetical protein